MVHLQGNPYFRQLVDGVSAARDDFIGRFARDIAFTGGPHAHEVNQRYVDYQRGFWSGAVFAVTQFPKKKAKDWEKFVAEQVKESDAA